MANSPPRNGLKKIGVNARCWWCGEDEQYVDYHDTEWGRPVSCDRTLFEKICLEGFQCGLSWRTVLAKRPAFREVFYDFEIARVARMRSATVDRLVQDARIIRHRGKIESALNNAKQARMMQEAHGSLGKFFRRFQPPKRFQRKRWRDIPAVTAESTAMSKELKRLGWSFVGPTTCYAFMQAMGLVNDHMVGCHCWQEVEDAQVAVSS